MGRQFSWIQLAIASRLRIPLLVALLGLSALATAPGARAQMPAHAYVPLEHWATFYVEHLIRRQIIPDPLPMIRPFTVGQLRQSLAAADTSGANSGEKEVLERIAAAFPYDSEWTGATIEGDAGIWAATHSRRNSNLREEGDGQVLPRIGANGALQAGVGAVVMHAEFDPNIDNDPDYGGRDTPINIYYPNAYLAFRSKHLLVDLGRTRRNWGPVGVSSLVVSNLPYPYDQFFFMIKTNRVYGHFLVADIDPMINSNGDLSKRYLAAHRMGVRPWDFIDIAVWGGQIISGTDQNWALWFINPVPVQAQSRDEQNENSNVLIGGDLELRLGDFRLAGSLSIDDLQVVDSGSLNDEPPSFALTGAADWSPGLGTYTLEYSLISNLSYRTHDPAESYLIDQNLERSRVGVGIGRNFSDYDLLTLRAGFLVGHCLLLRPELSYLRQGEGDLRDPFPDKEEFPNLPAVHTGVVEKTLRAAVQGSVAHSSGVQLTFDAGVHQISNYENIDGQSETKFVGSMTLRFLIGTGFDLE